jgi:hypothetical protein
MRDVKEIEMMQTDFVLEVPLALPAVNILRLSRKRK